MTLYTSDIKKSRILYIVGTAFCIVFALIYELNAHGVKSFYMILAFLIPLIGGIISEIYKRYLESRQENKNLPAGFLAGGIIWLTLGSLFAGVLEIYGTTNKLIYVFLIVGIIQLIMFFVAWIKH